ncbi:trimeric LpxA-like protein [Kalaharituber pfeilii]|nr:trimeric LpxA-like protein [Kalaharituber pfeilii]
MMRGDLYYAADPALCAARDRSAAACAEFNRAPGDLPRRERVALQNKILGLPPPPEDANLDRDYPVILAPFCADYGTNLRVAPGSFINFNCTFLDTCLITIGPRVLVGPNVSFYAATHPLDYRIRKGLVGPEMGKEIVVEEDVWIGGSVVICPGVTLGKGCVVGAGSVVTKVSSISLYGGA